MINAVYAPALEETGLIETSLYSVDVASAPTFEDFMKSDEEDDWRIFGEDDVVRNLMNAMTEETFDEEYSFLSSGIDADCHGCWSRLREDYKTPTRPSCQLCKRPLHDFSRGLIAARSAPVRRLDRDTPYLDLMLIIIEYRVPFMPQIHAAVVKEGMQSTRERMLTHS